MNAICMGTAFLCAHPPRATAPDAGESTSRTAIRARSSDGLAKWPGEREVGVYPAQSVHPPGVDAFLVHLVVDASRNIAYGTGEPGVLQMGRIESFRAVRAQK